MNPKQESAALQAVLSSGGFDAAERKVLQQEIDTIDEHVREFRDTDLANEWRLWKKHGADLLHTQERGWLVYDGKRWCPDNAAAIRKAKDTSLSIFDEIKNTIGPEQKLLFNWARRSQFADRIKAMLSLAESALAANYPDFDRDPWLFNCNNGTLDLRTGKLKPHHRGDKIRSIIPIDYGAGALCPRFEAFLRRVMADDDAMIEYLQRAVGYSLTGLTSEQVLFFLFGIGCNGKSVFTEILQAITGDYGLAARTETLMAQRSGGIPNDIARLAGVRFVAISETNEGAKLNESLVKDLTGGDTISARFLRREYFDFRPVFKLWIRGNHKPQIRGTDDGIWRRIHLVPFTERIADDERDPHLIDKLIGELPGILAWAVRGCAKWQEQGLNPPPTVTSAVAEYRSEMDVLGDFISERIDDKSKPDDKTSAKRLWIEYQNWCDDNKAAPISRTRFGLALSERGYRKEKNASDPDKGKTFYHGIRVRLS